MIDDVESWIVAQLDEARAVGRQGPEGQPFRRTYAIVDASRQPMVIPAALDAFASSVRCLFSGSALREFGDNAAWVVEIDSTEGTLRWLLEQGFNKRWAIFANSLLEIEPFVRHLKKFTVAEGDGGRTFFFRFYDPHVLRQYLPAFDERQVRLFFREIEDVFFEDTSGRHRLLKYNLADDGRLMTSLF